MTQALIIYNVVQPLFYDGFLFCRLCTGLIGIPLRLQKRYTNRYYNLLWPRMFLEHRLNTHFSYLLKFAKSDAFALLQSFVTPFSIVQSSVFFHKSLRIVESTSYHVRSPCLSPFSLHFSYRLVVWYDCPLVIKATPPLLYAPTERS